MSFTPAVRIRQCRHGIMMYPPGDVYVGRCLELFGEYGEGEMDAFRQLLHPGDVVVEAGANIGSLTVPLARLVGAQGRVIAFEPQRSIYQVLVGNLALNGLLNVDAHRMACGDAIGQLAVPVLPPAAQINYGGISTGQHFKGIPDENIPVVPLDSLNLPRLNFIKIDVEGAELAVIQGASQSLSTHRPILFLENDRQEKSPPLLQALLDRNYHLWWHITPLYRPDNFHANPLNELGNLVSINLLAIPAERNAAIQGLRRVSGPLDWWRS